MEQEEKVTLEETLEERGNNYGEYTDICVLSQAMSKLMGQADKRSAPVSQMDDVQRDSMKMIIVKMARIAVGDADFEDNWKDIQGYAKLVQDRLPRQKS
jgi:hypothetical protein